MKHRTAFQSYGLVAVASVLMLVSRGTAWARGSGGGEGRGGGEVDRLHGNARGRETSCQDSDDSSRRDGEREAGGGAGRVKIS